MESSKYNVRCVWVRHSSCRTVRIDSRRHRKSQYKSCISGKTLNQHLFISLSIFDVWGHMGILCSPAGHRGRNESIYSRYYVFQSRFSTILLPRGAWDNSEMCVSREVSSQKTLDSDGFLKSSVTHDLPLKWANTVSEEGIETSCVGIGQKLISVDRKVPTTMTMTFPTL